MTLVVDLFDPEGSPYLYAIDDDAAGFESYRQVLWSSDVLISRGARFLPQLGESNLFVYPEDLDAFANECQTILERATEIAREVWGEHADGDNIRRYARRFLAAVDLARQRGVGVCIS